jgi:plastocyanin
MAVEISNDERSNMKNIKKALIPAALLAALLLASACWAGEIKGKVNVQGLKSAENIAVYVDAIPGKTFDAPSQHVTIDQRKMTFIPHLAVVLKGTTVEFLNSDNVGHNVYWPSVSGNKKLAHNMGTWPKGQNKPFQFNDLGTASLLCNVHPEMSGYVVIAPTPYYAVTNKEGEFEIKNVPDGHYSLKTWSEDGKPATLTVDVSGGAATAELTVKK